MRYPKPYKPIGRKHYYFSYKDTSGKRRIQSTGCDRRDDADDEVRRFIDSRTTRSGRMSFTIYSAPFFVWETCPHVQRLLDSGKSIGRTHVETCRRWLDMWVIPDLTFSSLPMHDITRGDILDLRKRLRTRVFNESKRRRGEGLPTVNKVMASVKTILFEAYFREDIPANPADGVGNISYENKSPDILTLEEIKRIFSCPGKNVLAYRVFKTAAWTGMRCGEVLGAGIGQLCDGIFRIDHAWKHHKAETTGLPKWGKVREILLAPSIRIEIEEWIAARTSGLIFSQEDGKRLRETWWRENFKIILKNANIHIENRHLTPHSLRHSLNTHLLEAGVDPLRIQIYLWGTKIEPERQGISKIQSIYTHFQATITEPVARKIDELYGPEKQAKPQIAM